MSSERGITELREELKKLQKKYVELQTENASKEETNRKLTEDLKASKSYDVTWGHVVDMTLEGLARRRARALDRHRLEYENRVEHSETIMLNQGDDECYDEIDS